METSQLANLAMQVRSLPPQSAGRDFLLHRLTDLHAAAEAEAALRVAAADARADAGPLADVLASARDVWSRDREDAGRLPADGTARERLRGAVCSSAFRALLPDWIREMREIAAERPDTGACTLATGLQIWSWTLRHFEAIRDLPVESTRRAVDELADALCPVLAARTLVLEVAGRTPGGRADTGLRADLCHVHAAHAASVLGATCAELVFGYRRHLVWDSEGCAICYGGDELDALEGLIPGIATSAREVTDVIEADGSHAAKAGPCVRFDGLETFTHLRTRLDGCLSGARLAKERAATALAHPADESETPQTTTSTGGQ